MIDRARTLRVRLPADGRVSAPVATSKHRSSGAVEARRVAVRVRACAHPSRGACAAGGGPHVARPARIMLASKQLFTKIYKFESSAQPEIETAHPATGRDRPARRAGCVRRAAAIAAGLTPTRVSVLLHGRPRGPVRLSGTRRRRGHQPDDALARDLASSSRRVCSSAPATRRPPLRAGPARPRPAAGSRADPPRADRRGERRARAAAAERPAPDRAGPAGARGAGRAVARTRRVTRVVRAGRITFAALSVPNYRRYFGGQAISLIGTWMQMTAQAWLVLSLTHSSTALGRDRRAADASGAAARALRRRDRRSRRQAQADGRAADRDGRAGADPGPADGHRRGAGLGDRRPRRAARPQQRVREPLAAVVHARDGRRRHLRNAVSLNSVLVNVARASGRPSPGS